MLLKWLRLQQQSKQSARLDKGLNTALDKVLNEKVGQLWLPHFFLSRI
jgi:hypothetical protein